MKSAVHIFLGHEPLDSLLLAGNNRFVIEGDLEKRLFHSSPLFVKAYLEVYDMLKSLLPQDNILSAEKREQFKEHCRKRQTSSNIIVPYSLNLSLDDLSKELEDYNASLCGAQDPSHLIAIGRLLRNKIFVNNIIDNEFPGLQVPNTRVIPQIQRKLIEDYTRTHGRSIIKLPFGDGGKGSLVVDSWNSTIPYGKKAILQPWLNKVSSPSATYFVSDDEITELYISDQLLDDAKYSGSTFPSRTRFAGKIREFGAHFLGLIRDRGYRGYCNMDFIETQDRLFFSELNPRVPYSFYPFSFANSQSKGGVYGFKVSQHKIKLDESVPNRLTEMQPPGQVPFCLRETDENQIVFRTISINPN